MDLASITPGTRVRIEAEKDDGERARGPSVSRLPLRRLVSLGVAAAVAYWLLADTVRHYSPHSPTPNSIRFAHFGTYQDYRTWAEVVRVFEAEHPELHVCQEYVTGWYGLYDTKLRQQVLSGTLPEVVLVQYAPFRSLARHFETLEPSSFQEVSAGIGPDELDPIGLSCFRVEGCQRGLPVSGGNLLIYCNPECFRRASQHRGREIALPVESWTLNDFRRLAEELTCDLDGDGQLDQFGFWQPTWVYYLPFIWSFGADILDETNTQWRFTGPAAEEALRFYQELRFPNPVSPGPEDVAQIIQDVGFLTGKVAMCVNGPWFQPFLAQTRLADRFHLAPIPVGPAGRVTRVTWDGIAMRGGMPQPQRRHAETFIRFVGSPRAQAVLTASQRALPARRSADVEFTCRDGGRNGRRFVEALSYSRLQPETPHFAALDRALNSHLGRLLDARHPLSPARMLTDLAADPAIRDHFLLSASPR